MLNEEVDKRRQEIGRMIQRRSPMPPEDIRPHWMTEGIEETYEYWNLLAEIWDDLYTSDLEDQLTLRPHIPKTDKTLAILDIGCGTGKFWEKIWERAPNAHVTGIDLCPSMLNKARERYRENLSKISMIEGSTVDVPFGEECFDLVISILHVHFFSTEIRSKVYGKAFRALRRGGKYLAHDICQPQKQERENRRFYERFVSTLEGADTGTWNYKQTTSVATQQRLLSEAGFIDIEPWIVQLKPSGFSVFVAEKP